MTILYHISAHMISGWSEEQLDIWSDVRSHRTNHFKKTLIS